MLATHLRSSHANPGRRAGREQRYRVTLLLCLAGSLLAVTLLLRAPLHGAGQTITWHPPPIPISDQVEVSTTRSAQALRGEQGITAVAVGPEPQPRTATGEGNGGNTARDRPEQSTIRPMQARQTVYEQVESPPAIRGGLGAYYINIRYPPEAVAREIEGRLVLRFVVDTDGRAQDIEVVQSLHAICDSAAVQALRETTFIPGRQHGKEVQVRMQLPVRFRLVEPGTGTDG